MGQISFASAMILGLALLCTAAAAGHPLDFVEDIQPILEKHCIDCHGGDERNGGIGFDEMASLFAEADSGSRAIVVGDPAKSELIRRIRSTDEGEQMPPDGDRLSGSEIERLSQWIAEGATWPDTSVPTDAKEVVHAHWSFRPLSDPQPPPVHDESWPRNAIDRFIQADRESKGLFVAADAGAGTLVRRASYALTGLPPSPDEVARFVEDSRSPVGIDSAFSKLVDRLLGQPSYGERWGRHWMDWVRYADTAGDNSDFPIPQAYLYRNYIIDSFNQDLPYDRFLIEQIAGDLLPAESQDQQNRQRIATGYLAMARRFGSLVETYPWHLTIEDTIDNMGRTMLGLTLACARCHNHKFDPISTRDYYGLYGIFASTRYPFPGIELFQTQWDFVPLVADHEADAAFAPYRETTAKLTAELEQLLADCERQSLEDAAKAGSLTLAEQRERKEILDAMLLKARRAGTALANHLKTIPAIPTAYAVKDASAKHARIQIKGEPDRLGAEVPRQFPDVLGGYRLADEVAHSTSGRLELAQWIACADNPLTARVIVNRVWQRHFGIGLVPSASDFGLRGEAPTHPELLDWLANELIRSGWSIKHLHRLIMNSRTYQLSSHDLDKNLAIDPANRSYWKFNRQRLDAESIRDTLLWLSGSLDATMQSEPYPIPPMEEWKYTQHHPFKDDYASARRSVYLMTKRLTAQPYFQTFDGPDPNVCTSDRDQSITALQALYFVNDDFLHEQADRFARRVAMHSSHETERLHRAFETVLCRSPTAEETNLLREHLRAVQQHFEGDDEMDSKTWASLVRSLMRLNEFLYID